MKLSANIKLFLILTTLLVSCGKDGSYTPPTEQEKIIGSWTFKDQKDVYTFNTNGECTLDVWIDGNEIKHKDSWTLKDGILSFSKVKTECTVYFEDAQIMRMDCDKDGPIPPVTLNKK